MLFNLNKGEKIKKLMISFNLLVEVIKYIGIMKGAYKKYTFIGVVKNIFL
tara:strand:+ start:619 stop:768 length:150 start_codon:yes stop_codon:yes gene_type:complete